ncbi:MAG: class I SAM-dependent methyltransferase [Cyclobacteriaceae bacterium]
MGKGSHLNRDYFEQRANAFDTLNWFNDNSLNLWISQHLRRYGSSICDVGSGTGIMTEFYIQSGFSEVVLTEPSDEMCEQIRKKQFPNIVSLFSLPAERLNETERSVSVTLAKNSFHHFLDHDIALRNMVKMSNSAIAIVEVVVPDERCKEYITELVCRKEVGRPFSTIYSIRDLEIVLNLHTSGTRTLICDQYIEIESWLENSELSESEKADLLTLVESQPNDIKKIMHIHRKDSKTYQLRRIALIIGIVENPAGADL